MKSLQRVLRGCHPGKRFPVTVIFIVSLLPLLSGCPETDYGIDGCTRDDPPVVENFWSGPGLTDVTFLAFGDSQFGGGASDKNQLHVLAQPVPGDGGSVGDRSAQDLPAEARGGEDDDDQKELAGVHAGLPGGPAGKRGIAGAVQVHAHGGLVAVPAQERAPEEAVARGVQLGDEGIPTAIVRLIISAACRREGRRAAARCAG